MIKSNNSLFEGKAARDQIRKGRRQWTDPAALMAAFAESFGNVGT